MDGSSRNIEATVANLTEEVNRLITVNQALGRNMDTFFVIIMSMIIFWSLWIFATTLVPLPILVMQCGFAFLEAGSVRSKNTTNILLKNLLDSFIGCFVYWAIGYAFAFGDGNGFIGYSGWFGTYPAENRHQWLFQFVFAATATTIISGSVAERCDIWPYFIYSIVITGIVYPIVSRWAWHESGWLADGKTVIEGISYQDFAGSGVVHLTGGVAALFGAVFCGSRLGRFQMGTAVTLPGHSIPLAALGAFILVFGFFAFNGGSQFAISSKGDGKDVSLAIINTIVSGMSAAISNLVITKAVGYVQERRNGRSEVRSSWSLLTTINGALVGMVAICAGCNVLPNWAAFVIGIFASLFYFGISLGLVALEVDDPLDAVAVHGGGGIWGVLATPIFTKAVEPDLEVAKQFGVNLVGALAIIAWTSVWSLAIFGTLRLLKVLRVSKLMELRGMDIEKHGEPAYPIAAWKEAWSDFMNKSETDGKGSKGLINSLVGMSLPVNRDDGEDNKGYVIADIEEKQLKSVETKLEETAG